MRNLIFARKPPAQRRGARASSYAPSAETIDDDMSDRGDTDTRSDSLNPQAAHMRARATANKKIDDLAHKRKSSLSPNPKEVPHELILLRCLLFHLHKRPFCSSRYTI
jgi:hypothetical protein